MDEDDLHLLEFALNDYIDIRENEANNMNRKHDQKFTSLTNDMKCLLEKVRKM